MPTTTVNEINLYHESTGRGDPLLLLHGLGSSGRDWALQVPEFAAHYQVITLDTRGHGRSDKPAGPYSVPLFASDVAAFLRRLAPGRVHLLGLSMGGMIALQLALDAPELVRSLIIANSAAELRPRTPAERFAIWQRFLLMRLAGMRQMGQYLARRFFPRPEQAEIRRIFIERWAENDKPAYLATMRALLGWSVADRLPAISQPVLILSAEYDYIPRYLTDRLCAALPQAQFQRIPDSRHGSPVDQPALFNRAVLDFLAQLPDNGV